MSLVQIATQGWGWVADPLSGDPRGGVTVQIKNLNDSAATTWSAPGGSSNTADLTTNADGTIPRWIETGPYNVTIGSRTSRVEAVRGNPDAINLKDYGAAIDGATDDGAAWTAAIAALPSTGGKIIQPRGVSLTSSRLNVAGRRNVQIVGEGTDNDAGGFGSTLIFTGTGSSAFIDARNTVGFQIEGFNLLYGSNSFTGYMVDYGDNGGADTRKGGLSRCLVSGQTGSWTSMAAAVNLTNAVDMYFEQTTFMGGTYGVIGRLASTDYSNGHTFHHCKWQNNLTAHVKNAGESWTFISPIIEGLQGDKAGFYTYDSAAFQALTKGFTLINPWFGDVLATGGLGAQMNWAGHGLTIIGNRLGVETATVKGIVIGENNCNGITILGTCGVGPGSPLIDWNGKTGHTGVLIIPGDLAGGMALEASTRPAGAIVMASTGLLVGDLVLTNSIVANNNAGSQVQITSVAGSPGIVFGSGGDTVIQRINTDQLGLPNGDSLHLGTAATTNSFLQLWEQTADPAAGATNSARLFAKDNGAGKTQLVVRFPTGPPQVIATEP